MKLAVTRPPSVSQAPATPPARGSAMAGRGVTTFAGGASNAISNATAETTSASDAEVEGAQPVRVEITEAGEPAVWPDDAAESSFLAEARERGEVVKPSRATEEAVEDQADPKALPKLDELVNRIPAEVRETLEDLFRAKFVTVQRVPKKVFKKQPSERVDG